MSATRRHIPAIAWPTLTEAAKMVDVATSTLSRKDGIRTVPAGGRDLRVPPAEVLRLTELHQRRSVNEVAQELIDYAHEVKPEYAEAVEEDIEEYFDGRGPTQVDDTFLADLERLLPAHLFRRVVNMYKAAEGHLPGEIISRVPEDEDE